MGGTTAVILDLDGTIIDTESTCFEVGATVVAQHGKKLTKDVARSALGKRPIDCWQAIIDSLQLNVSAQALVDQTEPLLRARWPTVKALPGAVRLVEHLHRHNVPLAIATSTSRESFEIKMSAHVGLREKFGAVVCGDEVANGKPHPELFLAAAERLGVAPGQCLALEDAPSGIEAALAAGCQVVAIPSLPDKSAYAQVGCPVLASLLDFRPEDFGLPGFDDFVHGTVPLDPRWFINGPVVKGFGRGSKELGIPTANLAEDALDLTLGDAVSGIYYGWASVGSNPAVHKMVMSVGWNPYFNNERRTCEPWLLHEFDQDFYGEELRLVVCGYVRPEANFESLQALIDRIQEDGRVTERALQDPRFDYHQFAAFLTPLPGTSS